MPNPEDLERLYKAHMATLKDDQRIEQDLGLAEARKNEAKLSESKRKPILCLDFDGVCHSYTSGWQGASVINDPPVDGLFDFLAEAIGIFNVNIYSTRSNMPNGITAMVLWFEIWEERLSKARTPITPQLIFPKEKPSAMIMIDDRAITFTGQWPDMETLRAFKPWNK